MVFEVTLMKAKIIQIGNSKGLRLPKSIIEQCEFSDQVDLEVDGKVLLIKSFPKTEQRRTNWSEAFKQMAENSDDQHLVSDVFQDDEDFE
jgi:antitoxin MazE